MKRGVIAAAATVGALALAPSAMANGPCGVNYDGSHACGVNAPATISGNLVQENESDYYAFWAPAGTQIDPTLAYSGDNELTNDWGDSNARLLLYDSSGSGLAESGDSCDCGGIEQSTSLPYTLTDPGVYYIVVRGSADEPTIGSPRATPYTLGIAANSGSMQWPAPPPPPPPPPPSPTPPPAPAPPRPNCVIAGWHGTKRLFQARRALVTWHCQLGRVHYVWNRRVRRGIVFGIGYRVGSSHPYGTPVALWVSLGKRRR